MVFPSDWPSDCPPSSAVNAHGTVFRIVKNAPPLAADFATHRETGRLKSPPECLRCGLSVFRELGDAVHQRSLFPKLGQWIAQAILNADHGKMMLTAGQQPTHTTFWIYEGVDRPRLFAIVVETT
jgi:hypothetical protein